MGEVNFLKLSIISLSTIHARTSSSPRGRRSSISFVSITFILIWELIEINVTFSINGLSGRIIHATINDHLIHTTHLFVLLIQNRSSTKSTISNNSIRTTISNICLCGILQTFNPKRKLALLYIRSISTREIISNKRLIAILTLNIICSSLVIKCQKTRLTNRGTTGAPQIHIPTMSCNNLNTTRSIATFVHKDTIRGDHTIIGNTGNLISLTLETNASETKRIRNLDRIDHSIIHLRRSSLTSWHGNTTVQSRIPVKLRTKTYVCCIIRRTNGIIIDNKVGRNILDSFLHGRRINVHIVIPRNGKIAGIIQLS